LRREPYAYDDVILELRFELSFRHGKQRFERGLKPADSAIQVKPGECRDLGEIKLKLVPDKEGE